jgi:hypothetical protein
MTGDEIFEILNNGTFFWGHNNQPSIYLIVAILEQLPVTRVAGDSDRLQVAVSRDLSRLELWSLQILTPDDLQRDGWQFDLWWD